MAIAATLVPLVPLPSQDRAQTPQPSSGPGLSGLALRSDDFTRYASTADLLANISTGAGGTGGSHSLYIDGDGGHLVSLDQSVTYNGHATMKYTQPGGVGDTPWLAVYFPAPLAHIWYRVKVRFSPGWTDIGTLANSANAYKLLSWGWAGQDGSGRLEITNTTQYDFYWNIQRGSQGTLVGGGNHADAGFITGEWSTGAWYDYIIEVDHSAHTSGVARVWMARDGQRPVLKGTVSGRMFNGTALPLISSISVGLNFNQVRAKHQSQAIWWGQWEVVDGSRVADPFRVAGGM